MFKGGKIRRFGKKMGFMRKGKYLGEMVNYKVLY